MKNTNNAEDTMRREIKAITPAGKSQDGTDDMVTTTLECGHTDLRIAGSYNVEVGKFSYCDQCHADSIVPGEINYYMYHNPDESGANVPHGFRAWATFRTVEEADAFAAAFPKMVKARGGDASGVPGYHGSFSLEIYLRSTGVTGRLNETGIKRIKAFFKFCQKHDIPMVQRVSLGNAYPVCSIEVLLSHLEAQK